MSRLEELPPDQRAALSILLRQRKTYAEVAAMLGIGEQAVHDRAHAALAVLAPGKARELDPAVRQEVGDYVLGQQPGVAERLRTRTLLSTDAAASQWARALVAELDGTGELPEIPPAPPVGPTATAGGSPAPYSLAEAASSPSLWEPPQEPGSKRAGALLLGGILAAVIVAVAAILIFGDGGSSSKHTSSTSTTAKSTPKAESRFTLKPPGGHSASTGTVEILSEGGKHAFYIQAEHIPATKGFFYAVWLYNSAHSALPISKSPPVGKSHKLAGAALLPENAGEFHEILLTRETSTHPKHPGHVVLRGPFSLNG